MKKKVFALLICCSLVLAFSACKKEEKLPTDVSSEGEKKGEVSTEEIYAESLKALEGLDYGGYEFTFFVRDSDGAEADCYIEENSADLINNAVYERNLAVSELLNVTFTAVRSSNSNYETDALKTILAGDDAYDVVVPHARAAFAYAMQNTLLDWRSDLTYIDLSKPWWSSDMQKSFTINGRLLTMTGDLSHGALSSTKCIYFNKNLFDELGLEYPYQLVRDGEWTFDKFVALSEIAVKDLDGDGIINPEFDRIGFTTGEWSGPTEVIYTGGQRIYNVNEQGIPELVLYSEKTVDIFDKYFAFLDSDAAFCSTHTNFYGTVTGNLFREGRTLFTSAGLGSAVSYRDMEDDFGIIPLPKFSKDDAYATIVDGSHNLFCVPITASDPERTSAVLEALAIIGARDVIPAFYDVALQTRYTRDEESSEMMDIIRATRVYDLGYLAPNSLQSTGRDLANISGHDFASFYVQREDAVLKSIDEIIEAFSVQ